MERQSPALHHFSSADLAQYDLLTQFQHTLASAVLHDGSTALIENVLTDPIILSDAHTQLLATVNQNEYSNSHVCSPYATYITYPTTMVATFEKWWAKCLAQTMPRLLGLLFKLLKIDQVVQLNNHFSATPFKSPLLTTQTNAILSHVTTRYPNHLILIRRVNPITNPELTQALIDHNFLLIPDKPTHLFIPEKGFLKRSHTKRDLALLRKTSYEVVLHDDLTPEDLVRIHALYKTLFIEKHTDTNPKYTLRFFQLAHAHRWLEFVGLRHPSGSLDGFHSYVKQPGLMNCGPIGYDLQKPLSAGLYRLLVAQGLKTAHENNCIYNYGSGADQFKLNRGSEKVLEFTAVYYHHLPKYRHIPWDLLHFFSHNLTKKIFELNSL